MVIFIASIAFILLEQKINLNLKKKVCENKNFCGIVMPSEKDNVLEFNQYMKSDKMPYSIYANIESLIKKIDGFADNLENSPTTKVGTTKIGEYIPCGCSMSTMWAFENIENKHILYRGEDCMKNFYESLREHATNIIDFEKKKMLHLTDKTI